MDYNIHIGDKFFYDNFSTHNGQMFPDYLIVTDIRKNIVEAKYENHWVYTKERLFDIANLWTDSNLNPWAKNPGWIFLKQ